MTFQLLLDQFAAQFGLWWVIWPGILLGIVVGILPGFSPQNTLIMLLPLTLGIPVDHAFAFMVSLYCANHLAGGVPAILVKIPGSGGAAATTPDGYPMTQKGQAQQAIVLSFTASVFGGLITTLATLALLPWLSQIGLYLRSYPGEGDASPQRAPSKALIRAAVERARGWSHGRADAVEADSAGDPGAR